ncbi:MAG: anhydro-N-acetylmuramic acid kinase [Jaaginema sp. PMC 1079.18]|nr:anhydro-N-acetylmuramic acid kinase [Jaaginema sp. PMC 1080.18]MEC4851470.1 anhydro-N-acetylmuramic acid kinase [Jaaginema sp. PMC 1079.18]MEC4867007.1 anhydro-N-acetylmuramic acid kinase [Jaaginema sp. PMC 1078.18]
MKVIGLISGTSVDGIDAALVDISGQDLAIEVQLLAQTTYPYPEDLRSRILAVAGGAAISLEAMAQLDDEIAIAFAQAAQNIQKNHSQAELIGSHGQTVYHRPPDAPESDLSLGYTLQLGRGDAIALMTQIPTVANFRVADIALGGHGAPLVSRIDAALCAHPSRTRCLQNLGGIGNVTYLPPKNKPGWIEQILGWDTGPGNMLIDLAVAQLTQGKQTYDDKGAWAAQGQPCQTLVEQWLTQEFFQQPPPKSTGREHFGQAYLHRCWQDAQTYDLSPADWLATLTEFTAASVIQNYRDFLPHLPDEVLIGGGGSCNLYLLQRLQSLLPEAKVTTTEAAGLNAEAKEAIAFAILAYWYLDGTTPGNLPQVTGAKAPVRLGQLYNLGF